ncbi:hypothetical protein ACQP2F_24675 [Actinoplanes sp. CA-030573]|uniref:hypothetical protein n=1 Tax=Actinoplanes sp. CA-030573 TaxID=3239898 RepID=UPI003D89EE8E
MTWAITSSQAKASSSALLGVTPADLRRGGTAETAHGLSAVYLGVTVVFGSRMIAWADQRFAHRFAGGPPVKPPRTGREHAAYERRQWIRHLIAFGIAAAVLGGFSLLTEGAGPMWGVMGVWGLGAT